VEKIHERIVLPKEKDSLSLKLNFLPLKERPSKPRLSPSKGRKTLEDPM